MRIKPVVSLATATVPARETPTPKIARAVRSKREGGGPVIASILSHFVAFEEGDRKYNAAQVNMNGDAAKYNPFVLFVPVGLEPIPKTGDYHVPAGWHGVWYVSVRKANTIIAFGEKNAK